MKLPDIERKKQKILFHYFMTENSLKIQSVFKNKLNF